MLLVLAIHESRMILCLLRDSSDFLLLSHVMLNHLVASVAFEFTVTCMQSNCFIDYWSFVSD